MRVPACVCAYVREPKVAFMLHVFECLVYCTDYGQAVG